MRKKQPIKSQRVAKAKAKKVGLAPGTLIYTGNRSEKAVHISVINYSATFFEETKNSRLEDILISDEKDHISWIDIDGIHDVAVIEKIGKHFEIHPLILEDILHPSQQPKVEDYEKNIYCVLRMLTYDQKNSAIVKDDQISLILGTNYLITFQEDDVEAFNMVKERIRKGGFQSHGEKPDFLAYALMDAIVDSYFQILEQIVEDIEELEDQVILNPDKNVIQNLHVLRRGLLQLRKAVWPLREMLGILLRNENGMILPSTKVFLKDVNDHAAQLVENIESYRDMVIGIQDLYLSTLSNKMNEVMKMLTIIATIFIPLTFLAGIYGMNFKYFPELGWKWMYPWGFWILTILIIALLLWFSKKKKWI